MSGTNTALQPTFTTQSPQYSQAGTSQTYSPFMPIYSASNYSPMRSYNPYYAPGGGGYGAMFTPNYYNTMAYGMAGLPSYGIPYAGNYYTQPMMSSGTFNPFNPYSFSGSNPYASAPTGSYTGTPYVNPRSISYSQNLPYYAPGIGWGSVEDYL